MLRIGWLSTRNGTKRTVASDPLGLDEPVVAATVWPVEVAQLETRRWVPAPRPRTATDVSSIVVLGFEGRTGSESGLGEFDFDQRYVAVAGVGLAAQHDVNLGAVRVGRLGFGECIERVAVFVLDVVEYGRVDPEEVPDRSLLIVGEATEDVEGEGL